MCVCVLSHCVTEVNFQNTNFSYVISQYFCFHFLLLICFFCFLVLASFLIFLSYFSFTFDVLWKSRDAHLGWKHNRIILQSRGKEIDGAVQEVLRSISANIKRSCGLGKIFKCRDGFHLLYNLLLLYKPLGNLVKFVGVTFCWIRHSCFIEFIVTNIRVGLWTKTDPKRKKM